MPQGNKGLINHISNRSIKKIFTKLGQQQIQSIVGKFLHYSWAVPTILPAIDEIVTFQVHLTGDIVKQTNMLIDHMET